jgi:small conductance mechanosensitive channel
VHIVAPNAQLWGTAVMNYSHNPTRRMDLVVGIAYEDSIESAMTAARALLAGETRLLHDPAPMIVVSELADSSVNLTLRFWCKREDYWDLKFELTRAVKEAFDAAGVTIPYPQRTLHMVKAAGEA